MKVDLEKCYFRKPKEIEGYNLKSHYCECGCKKSYWQYKKESKKESKDLAQLKVMLEPFKNTLVIYDTNVVRIFDATEDDDDCYFVYDNGKQIIEASCLLGWIPLKGYISDDKYNNLVRVWNLNNNKKAI